MGTEVLDHIGIEAQRYEALGGALLRATEAAVEGNDFRRDFGSRARARKILLSPLRF